MTSKHMPSSTERRFLARPYFVVEGLVLLACAPAAFMAYCVTENWVSVPLWDEWNTPAKLLISWSQGTLNFAELFSQHNESRKVFPGLVYLALAKLHGWDVRDGMVITLLSTGAIVALLFSLLKRTPGATTISALIAWVVMVFLCYSPVQFENYLWGLQFEPLFPGLAVLTAAAVNLSRLSFGLKTVVNTLLALIATYTFANGMLLWLLAIPLPSSPDSTTRRRRIGWYAAFLICAATAVGCYFINYAPPGSHPQLFSGTEKIGNFAHYLLLWVGSYFQSSALSPLMAGTIVVTAFAAAMVWTIVIIARERKWRAFYPWLLLAAYACGTAIVTTAGRLGFGVTQALDNRYTILSLSFHLATIGILYALYCSKIYTGKLSQRRFFVVICAVLIGFVATSLFWCYRDGLKQLHALHERHLRLQRALEWVDAVPDNPDLALIFPVVDVLTARVHTLAENKLLRVRFASQAIASAIKYPPRAPDFSNGCIDGCIIDAAHELFIAGWAWLPSQRQADCVVIGCEDAEGNFKPVAIFETGMPRPDVGTAHHKKEMSHTGFARSANPRNFPRGDVKLQAWAIDLKEEKVFPLAGVISWRVE
jgi:hypothetical protein